MSFLGLSYIASNNNLHENEYDKYGLYNEKLITSIEHLKKDEFTESLNLITECLNIATEINDPYRMNEATLYQAIINFNKGSLLEALSQFELIYSRINTEYSRFSYSFKYPYLKFLLKASTNWMLCYIALNRWTDATLIMDNIMKIISSEVSSQKQRLLIYEVKNNLLYKDQGSISDTDVITENYINTTREDSIKHWEIISKLIKGFDSFMVNDNCQAWIECLRGLINEIEVIKDYNGWWFLVVQELLAIMINPDTNNEEKRVSEDKLNLWLSVFNKGHNQGNLSKIVNGYKIKWLAVYQFYKRINDKEREVEKTWEMIRSNNNNNNNSNNNNNNVNSNPDNSVIHWNMSTITGETHTQFQPHLTQVNTTGTELFLKLLLHYTINQINSMSNPSNLVLNQLEQTLTLVRNKQLTFSNVKLNTLSPELNEYIITLFKNLFYIKEKNRKYQNFKKYQFRVHKAGEANRQHILDLFFQECCLAIYSGNKMIKYNYNTKGFIVHFYQFDYKDEANCLYPKPADQLEIFETSSSWHAYKIIKLTQIKAILIGIRTRNWIRKFEELKDREKPWLYLSFWWIKGTWDLKFFDEETAKKWFYGFAYFLNKKRQSYKIMSCTGFVLMRLKMKMLSKQNKMMNNIGIVSFTKTFWSYLKGVE